jgi:DNA (cytosine-5)-methyltransferase 1
LPAARSWAIDLWRRSPRIPGPAHPGRRDRAQDPRFLRTFDLVHASPPCQFGTALRHAPGTKKDHLNLIPATRRLLEAAGVPYVIENVEAVRQHLVDPIRLCGTSFGLGAQGCQLHRHRLFEASFPVVAPVCEHGSGPVIGVYGGHARKRSAKHGGRGTRDVWEGGHVAACREAMGIGWMTLSEISEAIPPAFTHHIGTAFKAWLRTMQEAA